MFIRGLNGNMINTKYVQGIKIREIEFIASGATLNLAPRGQFIVEAILTDKRSVTMQEFCTNDAKANRQAAEAYTAELFDKLNGGKK